MIKKLAAVLLLNLLVAGQALAASCGAYPTTLTNGTTADANQVMANFNLVRTCVTTNAASIGANADITSLSGLSTPLSKSQGGTGDATGLSVIPWAVAGGSADTISATYSPAITLTDGIVVGFRATAANAGSTPTFNPNTLGGNTITKLGGVALAPKDIPGANAEVLLRYRSASNTWEMLNPSQVGLNLLASTTASGAGAFAITNITSAYDEYLFEIISLVPATSATNLLIRVSEDGGSSYKSGGSDYQYAWSGFVAGGVAATSGSTGASAIQLLTNLSNSTGNPAVATVRLFNPSGGTTSKQFLWQIGALNATSSGYSNSNGVGSYIGTTNAINALEFFMSSGNITATINTYGVRKN